MRSPKGWLDEISGENREAAPQNNAGGGGIERKMLKVYAEIRKDIF